MVKCDKDINTVALKEIVASVSLWLGKSKLMIFFCGFFFKNQQLSIYKDSKVRLLENA